MMTPGNFEQFLPRLSSCGVKYILIGGGAAIVHGLARATYDVDIIYERSPENLAALVAAMRDLNPYYRGAPPRIIPIRTNAGPFQFVKIRAISAYPSRLAIFQNPTGLPCGSKKIEN